jgi:hypothetical protein
MIAPIAATPTRKDTSARARLVFVMDNDFGALGVAMYLLYGPELTARATLLLPRRAYELHKGHLQVDSRPYDSLGDILDFVRADSPALVFLVSGYLFARQNLLSIGELRKLVRELRSRGCSIATSDPYLGHFDAMARASVPVRTGRIPKALRARLGHIPWIYRPLSAVVDGLARMRLARHVRRVSAILADVAHFYPAAVTASRDGPACFSFFNPAYFAGPRESTAPGERAGRPRWLFVLAQFDLSFQEQQYGRQRFVELVAAKLHEARDQGKHPTFIGPPAFAEELSRHFPADAGVTLLGRCPYGEFEERLFDAEVAFYWQIFSTSAFVRLWNGLPVFSFDPGHTSRFSSVLHDAGLKHYFMGRSPCYLDIESPLDAVALGRTFDDFRRAAREATTQLASLPSPGAMVEAIIRADRRTG